jgi:hypothetical protein
VKRRLQYCLHENRFIEGDELRLVDNVRVFPKIEIDMKRLPTAERLAMFYLMVSSKHHFDSFPYKVIKCKRCNETFKCMVEMTEHDRLNHPQESVEKPVKSEKNKGIPKSSMLAKCLILSVI